METENFTDETPMPFGKYKGQALVNVPASHLLWLYRNERAGRLKTYILENFNVLEIQALNETKGKGNKS